MSWPPSYLIGVDLGQAQDPSAIAVLERAERPTGRTERYASWVAAFSGRAGSPYRERAQTESVYLVRHLERLPLGTPYPAVVARTAAVLRALPGPPLLAEPRPRRLARGRPTLVVDQTGVGRAVVDHMRQAGLRPVPVTITAGDAASREGDGYRVPKRELVGLLQLLVQAGRLRVAAALPEAPVLQRELLAVRVRITPAAHEAYGAWREGEHDDLVLAVALACWVGEYGPRPARPAE